MAIGGRGRTGEITPRFLDITMSQRESNLNADGAVAQLGERCNRTAEVRGSIPLGSTNEIMHLVGSL